ncbi:AAA family ATPase [Streptomyces sp. NPDC005480]|uniref:ParA family protein n=1 Tax=Streptomyces sp. NPDC005480 TaxID=3154880 RepID=UPI0033A7379C
MAGQRRGFSKESALKRALTALEPEYDIVIVDCPPSLGTTSASALAPPPRCRDREPCHRHCERRALSGTPYRPARRQINENVVSPRNGATRKIPCRKAPPYSPQGPFTVLADSWPFTSACPTDLGPRAVGR